MCDKTEFSGAKSLNEAVCALKTAGVAHRCYCHYTNLDALKAMLENKTFRLTRGDSQLFDDDLERKKYGSADRRKKTYMGCFSYVQSESAAFWGLYCPPTYKAIRIRFAKTSIQKLLESTAAFACRNGKRNGKIDVDSAVFSDVAYACVPFDKYDDKNRSKTVFHDGENTAKIPKLDDQKYNSKVTGLVKDYEWRFENESRLLIRTKKTHGEHILVSLPKGVIANMHFTLSPWATDEEKELVKTSIKRWFAKAKVEWPKKEMFSKSVLEGGLKKWARQRGL